MNKYDVNFVINFYKQHGCELLEPYTNSRKSLKYRCKCGNISQNNFFYFMKSPYCWDCAAAKQAHNQEYIEIIFKERGCELFDIYKNNHTKMKFRCKCGKISTITFASFNDKGCYCENCGGTKKLTLEKISEEICKFNYKVLNKEYINATTKLELVCDKGHECQISWNNFKNGKRCKTCFIENNWHHPDDRPFVLLCRSLLRNCLKKIGLKKTDKTEKLLGYNGIQLKNHITSHPNWNNIYNEWHLDHIFPIKAFCDYKIKDIALINCLDNLQPLRGKENLYKSSKYDKQKFKEWLISKGINI